MARYEETYQSDVFEAVQRTVRIERYAIDIAGLPLKQKANGEWWGTCPFHKESTPSFHIRPAHQDFKCFGCGAGGDVIDLEMNLSGETNARLAAERILDAAGGRGDTKTQRPRRTMVALATPELSSPAERWLGDRGIGMAVATRNRIGNSDNAIVFPYIVGGELVNRQARSLTSKRFRFETGADVVPFGLDDCAGMSIVTIVEGVMDKLSIEQATGDTAVLAFPGATPSGECYGLAGDTLESAQKILLAGDADEPGEKLRDELVRRLGADRCWLVSWPDGCKDANDVLLAHGADGIRSALANAQPLPVEGVFDIDDSWDALSRLYAEGMPPGALTGWANLDRLYTVRRKQLTVITGVPGSGKTLFADALMMNLAKRSWEWSFAVCSPEMQPLERHWAHLVSLYIGKPFGNGPTSRVTPTELASAREFLRDKFYMVLPEEPTLDAVIDRFLWTHRRHGVGGLVLDPWNELDHSRPPRMSETEYINGELRKLKRLGWQHDVWIALVAHPTKLYRDKEGKYPIPTLYDISGSAAFFNKTDNGIVLWRDKAINDGLVDVHVQKVRFHEVGGLGTVQLRHDRLTGRYSEVAGP